MHVIWRLQKSFVKDILEEITKNKPHYNTLWISFNKKNISILELSINQKTNYHVTLTIKTALEISNHPPLGYQF